MLSKKVALEKKRAAALVEKILLHKKVTKKINIKGSSKQCLERYLDAQDWLPKYMPNLLNPFAKLADLAGDALSRGEVGLQQTKELMDSILMKVDGIVEGLSKHIPSDVIPNIKELFIALVFALYQQSFMPLVQFSVTALGTHLGSLLTTTLEYLYPKFTNNPITQYLSMPQTQDFVEENVDIFRMIVGVIGVVCATLYGISNIDYASLLNKMSLVGRACQGYKNFTDMFDRAFEYVEDIFFKYLYGENRHERDLKVMYPYLPTCFDILSSMKQNSSVKELLGSNRSACRLLVWCYKHVCNQLDNAITRRQTELVLKIKEYKRDLASLSMYADTLLNSRCQSRIAPVVTLLCGEAGTGKTQLQDMMCAELSEKYYNDVSTNVLKYARKAETEYWDGYRPEHKIVTYDDIFQIADSVSKPNPEVMEIIRIANSESYQLHMSAVEDKNNTFFNADFVFGTTNVYNFEPKSIASKDALNRRFDIKCVVGVKKEYGRQADSGSHLVPDPRLVWKKQNPNKSEKDMLEAMASDSFHIVNDSDIYELEVDYTLYGQRHINELMSFVQFRDLVFRKRKEKENAFDDVSRPLEMEFDEELQKFHDILVSKVEDKGDQADFIDCEDSLSQRILANIGFMTDCCKRNFVAVTSSFSWDSLYSLATKCFKTLWNHMGSIALVLQLLNIGWKYFTSCPLRKALEKGDTISSVLSQPLCNCKLCVQIKEHCIDLVADMRCLVEKEDVHSILAVIASACRNCNVSMHQGYVFKKVPRLIAPNSTFRFFQGSFLTYFANVESRQDDKYRNVNVESYQDFKAKNIAIESWQEKKPVTPVVESHQERKPRAVDVESYQDKKLHNVYVESYQDKKGQNIKVESEGSVDDEINDLVTQATSDKNCSDVIRSLFAKNLVKVKNPQTGAQVHGLFVRGNWMLVNRHFVNYLSESNFELMELGSSKWTKVSYSDTQSITRGGVDIDMVLIRLTTGTISARPDITKHFPSKSELMSLKASTEHGMVRIVKSLNMYLRSAQSELLVPSLEVATEVDFFDSKQSRHSTGDIYNLRTGIVASANTGPGDCGAPYLIYNPSCRSKILGIHSAGSAGRAYGCIITSDDFDQAVTQDICPNYEGLDLSYYSLLPNTISLGKVKGVAQPSKTNIRESSLHGIFEVKKAPAILYDREEDLLVKNTLKVTKYTTPLDDLLLDICEANILKCFKKGRKDVDKILSHKESIAGIEDCNFIDGINVHTSAGYPYNLSSGSYPGKTRWLGNNGAYRDDDPQVLSHVERIIAEAKRGDYRPLDCIFNASLKDERRTLDKVRAKKTRVFAASNLGLTLAIRRYFMGFMKNIMDNRVDNEIGLGINVYSLDWRRLQQRLASNGDNIIAGDFSNFDGSLNAQILNRIANIVNQWYDDSEENQRVRQVLMHTLFQSTWLLRDQVFHLNHSQPSGNPLTTMINCLYNMFIFRYCYLLACKDNGVSQTLINYKRDVKGVFYGDDSIVSVSSGIIDWFNQLTITKYMAMTGHDYTDETKSGAQHTCRPLSECTFLKRSFIKRDGMWSAPLAVDTIEDMVMWRKSSMANSDAILQTTAQASFEAFFHGQGFFDMYTQCVRTQCAKLGLDYGGLTYQECFNLWSDLQNSYMSDADLSKILFSY